MSGRYVDNYRRAGVRNGRGGRQGRGHYSQDSGSRSPDVLNFKVGQTISAVGFTRWMLKLREKLGAKYNKFGLNNIISREGFIEDYNRSEEPEEPDDPANVVEFAKWKTKYGGWSKDIADFDAMILGCTSIIWEHIGFDSRQRLIERNNSLDIADKKSLDDPVDILRLCLATHSSDTNLDVSNNVLTAEMNYVNVKMYADESLAYYLQRFNILETTYSQLMIDAGSTPGEVIVRLGTMEMKARKWILGLDPARFRAHQQKYISRDRLYPTTIEEAYNDATLFVQSTPYVQRRGIFITHPVGRGNGAGRTNMVECTRCGVRGYHTASECHNDIGSRGRGRGAGRGRDDGRGRVGERGRGNGRGRGAGAPATAGTANVPN
jgi:hypothetical protein